MHALVEIDRAGIICVCNKLRVAIDGGGVCTAVIIEVYAHPFNQETSPSNYALINLALSAALLSIHPTAAL